MRTSIIQEDRLGLIHYPANGWTVVEVTGDVDAHTAPRIREAVIALLNEGHRHFVLDLCPAPFLDSMGLGMIVAITKRIRDREGSLRLTCVNDKILKIFGICDLRRIYAFHDSVDQATRRAPQRGGLARWPRPLLT
ncbi:STAS domain-containing protein [Streptomyces sp. TRM S81-3]|uniref:Anti-sigma factor antagonist n=1 Tax=Streptomyces griseicoloratus TaxID=2752516 RepID=A0A926L8G4_9ACTN|nr:STAS domain-containing protein [Streptomyces griseicoloratus]MBD0424575.1 STAS domain-containing protein [Streptomyces griseicoloratus]